jgi:hypothetical protein
MKRLRTGVVCLSGVLVAAGMAMAGPPGAANQALKGQTPGRKDPRPAPAQADGGTSGAQADVPELPSVPKQPVQFSQWSRAKKRWTPDEARNLYTVIYEGGPKDPHHFYAYGFDLKRRQNVFFVTGDLKELSKFRSMLPPPPSAPGTPQEPSTLGASDAGTPTTQPLPNISQLPGGEPPPPPPSIHDPYNVWLPYAYRAWTTSFQMYRLATPIKATPSP